MYIRKLYIKNFKCFNEIELEFHSKLTVIVGTNGSGKTSVMESAAIAISTMFVKMDGFMGKSIDKAQAHLKAFSMGSTRDIQPQYPVTVRASASIGDETLTWSRSLNNSKGNTTIVDAKEIIDAGLKLQKHVKRIKGNDDVKIQFNIGSGELELAYRNEAGELMRIPVDHLSDGYKSTISLVADIAYVWLYLILNCSEMYALKRVE